VPERIDELSSTGTAGPGPAPRRSGLPEGWPVLALFGGFPIWWALGLSSVVCILFAAPMLVWLLLKGRTRVPKGFGWWLAFLFWMLLSSTQLDDARRWYAFTYRGVLYLSMTVMFVYVYNLPRSAMPTRRIVLALALFWAAVIGFGFAALAAPNFRLTTPAAMLLPAELQASSYVQELFNPRLAQVQTFIGYALTRPAAPFTYTNEWGGAVGLLTPMALAAIGLVRSYLVRNAIRLLLVASLVPIVISANRGLWVGLAAGLVYAAVRVALRGNARALVAIVGFLALVAALVALTPLERYVGDRLAHQHSNERRESLADQAVAGALERPLLGYGGPRESSETPNAPDIGTHGQVYLVIFSHGVPGLAFFLGWWLWVLWISHRAATGPPLWCHVMLLIGVLEFLYYDMMPTQLHLMMVVAAVAWRDREAQAAAAQRRSGTETRETVATT
jgi:polysaccharide biosynthesis protein PslJ